MRLDCVPGERGDNPYDDLTDEIEDTMGFEIITDVKRNPLLLYLVVMKDYTLAQFDILFALAIAITPLAIVNELLMIPFYVFLILLWGSGGIYNYLQADFDWLTNITATTVAIRVLGGAVEWILRIVAFYWAYKIGVVADRWDQESELIIRRGLTEVDIDENRDLITELQGYGNAIVDSATWVVWSHLAPIPLFA